MMRAMPLWTMLLAELWQAQMRSTAAKADRAMRLQTERGSKTAVQVTF